MKRQQLHTKVIRFIYGAASLFYTACLVYIVFFARRRWGPIPQRNYNLVPFKNKTHYLQSYTFHMTPPYVEFYKDLVGNIILFIPFPFLLLYILGARNYLQLLLISAATSLFIEITQFTFRIGVADIDDLLLNTMGAAIGLVIIHLVAKMNTALLPLERATNNKMRYRTAAKLK